MGKRILLITGLLCLLILNNSIYAALIDRGTGMIYDTGLGITWLQDANYAKTSGFDSDGAMPFQDGLEWVESLEYAGYTDWRLPFAGSPPLWFCAEQRSEMGHLYYVELDNFENDFWNPGPFINLYLGHLAQGLPEETPPDRCFYFAWSYGWQDTAPLYSHGIPWPVRDGDTGPSVALGSDYVVDLTLGATFFFDYWCEMSPEPTGRKPKPDILQISIGKSTYRLKLTGSSSSWETVTFTVPKKLRGSDAEITFSVYDNGPVTGPTVYLKDIN